MRCIVFDASPVISLAMNSLLPVACELKKHYKGSFCITQCVKEEVVDAPLDTKKFKFQALQILRLINDKIITVISSEKFSELRDKLLQLANGIYIAKENPIRIVHRGEMESLAAAVTERASAYVVDERTTRKLIEEPMVLKEILEQKLHTQVKINSSNLDEFKKLVGEIRLLRSFELMIIAFELGILDDYLPETENPKRVLLEAVLWGLKLDGCAVSQEEIEGMVVSETRQ